MSGSPPTEQPAGEGDVPGSKWGTSIALDDDADLKPNGRGGWARVHDETSATQDLEVSMLTPEGSDPLRRRYGRNLFKLLSEPIPTLKREITRVMNYDPRVDRVVNIDVDRAAPGDRENVDVTVAVSLNDGTIRTFQFPIRNRTPR